MQLDKTSNRYRNPASDAELNRRFHAIQASMKRDGLDGVILQTQNLTFDRGMRYFLDTQAHGYGSALLIPAEGGMVYISSGGENYDAPLPEWARNVDRVMVLPYCPPFLFTDSLAGNAMAEEIKKRNLKKLGFYQKQSMSLAFGDSLREALPDCEFTDYSAEIYKLSAVKSEEEFELINKSLRIHEQVITAVPALLRPGKKESQLQAEIEEMALALGCDTIGNLSIGSAPKGGHAAIVPRVMENRTFCDGDTVMVMIEAAGPGGEYCELARLYTLGEPGENLVGLFEIAKGAQECVAKAAKPGVTGGELNRIYDEYLAQYGLPANTRFVGHSQGFDMMESPAICPGETMPLEKDMFIAIHPELVRDGEFAICCDNFRVTENGAVRMTRTPQEIIRVEY